MRTTESPLRALSNELVCLIEDQLSNNEASSDEELRNYFTACGLTDGQAMEALTYRDVYLIHSYANGETPIRSC
jgi:hypothetical protein